MQLVRGWSRTRQHVTKSKCKSTVQSGDQNFARLDSASECHDSEARNFDDNSQSSYCLLIFVLLPVNNNNNTPANSISWLPQPLTSGEQFPRSNALKLSSTVFAIRDLRFCLNIQESCRKRRSCDHFCVGDPKVPPYPLRAPVSEGRSLLDFYNFQHRNAIYARTTPTK